MRFFLILTFLFNLLSTITFASSVNDTTSRQLRTKYLCKVATKDFQNKRFAVLLMNIPYNNLNHIHQLQEQQAAFPIPPKRQRFQSTAQNLLGLAQST